MKTSVIGQTLEKENSRLRQALINGAEELNIRKHELELEHHANKTFLNENARLRNALFMAMDGLDRFFLDWPDIYEKKRPEVFLQLKTRLREAMKP